MFSQTQYLTNETASLLRRAHFRRLYDVETIEHNAREQWLVIPNIKFENFF
jgi:hypothetical protein